MTRTNMVRQHINYITRMTKTREEQKPLNKGEVFEALLQQPRRNARQPGSVLQFYLIFLLALGSFL